MKARNACVFTCSPVHLFTCSDSRGPRMHVSGILLAAGRAERFGAAKLLVPIATGPHAGLPVGIAAYRNLRSALADVIVVVRPGDRTLIKHFEGERARIVVAERAELGMGVSLAAGVAADADAEAYVVALADMPWIDPRTIARIAEALAGGATIVAPCYRGERGHPVGFAREHRDALLALTGDEGARETVASHRDTLLLIDVDDPGVVRDIDTPEDLRRLT